MSRPATPPAAAARKAVLDRLAQRDPITTEYQLILTERAATDMQAAQERLLDAEENGDETAIASAQAAVEVARAQLAADTITLRFAGLPRAAYRALMDEHEPTEKQNAAVEGGRLRWNPDTFPDALIAATCIDPGFDSVAQVAALFSSSESRLSAAEADGVFATARLACEGVREVIDWGKGSGETAD